MYFTDTCIIIFCLSFFPSSYTTLPALHCRLSYFPIFAFIKIKKSFCIYCIISLFTINTNFFNSWFLKTPFIITIRSIIINTCIIILKVFFNTLLKVFFNTPLKNTYLPPINFFSTLFVSVIR